MQREITSNLHEALDTKSTATTNYTQIIDKQMGNVGIAYSALYWITLFLIIGMIIAIMIGSYMVTTKPVFFVPYIFIVIIAVIVAAGVANAYEQIMATPDLAATFQGFVGSNFILLNLPIWVSVIGIAGGIIMFIRMQQSEVFYGG